jgi:hypothetical protein
MGEQHLRSTGLRFGVARRILILTGYPASDTSGDEGTEFVELVEEAEETEELGRCLELLIDIELAADESISESCPLEGMWADSRDCKILE